MLANKDRKIAEELKTRLLACNGTRIKQVLLYGSRAQGTATEESDFDLLIVEKIPSLSGRRWRVFVKLSAMRIVSLISGSWESWSLKRQNT
jgi:predicted nucleotidyltransferase